MKLDLIKRNTIEIIEEKELSGLGDSPTAYCGYEPSGPVHLGHLASIEKVKDLVSAGARVKILLADVHAWLNRKGDLTDIAEWAKYWENVFKALGVEAEFVLGSDYQFSEDYVKDVFLLANELTINRALRSMQQVARDVENARVSQIIYPAMQVMDIKHLRVELALGGMEQRKIHMLAREYLPKMGWKKPVCIHHELIVSLKGPGTKMSSSDPSTIIAVHEDKESIMKKINSAYCPKQEIKDNPILQIAKLVIFPELGSLKIERDAKYGGDLELNSYQELEDAFKSGLHPLDLKRAVAEALSEILKPCKGLKPPI